jgi:hypothetical protein
MSGSVLLIGHLATSRSRVDPSSRCERNPLRQQCSERRAMATRLILTVASELRIFRALGEVEAYRRATIVPTRDGRY